MNLTATEYVHYSKPEKVFSHTVTDHFVIRIQFKGLLVAVKQILDPCQRIQLLCPFKESELKRFLENKTHSSVNENYQKLGIEP